ncbi:MAG: DUF4321 domain-containing protein [Ruminococcus sp.]|jgi:hypothetical protein|nr:DUF4321 domain-containing protein [Ruminococcus sp.]
MNGGGLKKAIIFLIFLMGGIVVGTAVAELLKDVPGLNILSQTWSVGLSTDAPAVLDLIVFKVAFGFTLSVSVSQIIFIIAALIIQSKVLK